MATCKQCDRYDACGGYTPSDLDDDNVRRYCQIGKNDQIPDVDERCVSFKPLSTPCAECAYFEPFEGGRLVRARCPRTGTAFLRQKMSKETVVLDPKVHTCREAVPKLQTFGEGRNNDGN